VIVVTINYRLGPFGFLGVQGGVGVGTGHLNGLYDQIVALQWVHDNIAAFGGDPSKVTVFGESAGSLSICMLCVSPLASGLFVRAIMESGACTYDSYWGAYDETDESDSPTAADLQAMSVVDVMALPGSGPAHAVKRP
jgi:carboxylesterase type B